MYIFLVGILVVSKSTCLTPELLKIPTILEF